MSYYCYRGVICSWIPYPRRCSARLFAWIRALLVVALTPSSGFAQSRVIVSVIPSLAYGPNCSSTVELQNLSDRTLSIDVEGHRETGALVGLVGLSGSTVHLAGAPSTRPIPPVNRLRILECQRCGFDPVREQDQVGARPARVRHDEAIKSDRMKPSEAMRLLDDYERGLKEYTYLSF